MCQQALSGLYPNVEHYRSDRLEARWRALPATTTAPRTGTTDASRLGIPWSPTSEEDFTVYKPWAPAAADFVLQMDLLATASPCLRTSRQAIPLPEARRKTAGPSTLHPFARPQADTRQKRQLAAHLPCHLFELHPLRCQPEASVPERHGVASRMTQICREHWGAISQGGCHRRHPSRARGRTRLPDRSRTPLGLRSRRSLRRQAGHRPQRRNSPLPPHSEHRRLRRRPAERPL